MLVLVQQCAEAVPRAAALAVLRQRRHEAALGLVAVAGCLGLLTARDELRGVERLQVGAGRVAQRGTSVGDGGRRARAHLQIQHAVVVVTEDPGVGRG